VVPFANDGFVRYNAMPINNSGTSYEVGAFYDNTSRNGLVVGSVTHDTWKTGIFFLRDEQQAEAGERLAGQGNSGQEAGRVPEHGPDCHVARPCEQEDNQGVCSRKEVSMSGVLTSTSTRGELSALGLLLSQPKYVAKSSCTNWSRVIAKNHPRALRLWPGVRARPTRKGSGRPP
jgi:hypothetical protein